jgi:hypothetical protein
MGKGSTYGPVRWAARNGDLYRSRRDCIWLALSVAALLPFRALGESLSRVWRMGFLAHGHESFYDALFESLAPLGYVEARISLSSADTQRAIRSDLPNLPPTWSV